MIHTVSVCTMRDLAIPRMMPSFDSRGRWMKIINACIRLITTHSCTTGQAASMSFDPFFIFWEEDAWLIRLHPDGVSYVYG